LRGKPVAGPTLEAEARVQVLAHDQVLDLGGLGQQVPQVLAVLYDDGGFSHGCILLLCLLPIPADPVKDDQILTRFFVLRAFRGESEGNGDYSSGQEKCDPGNRGSCRLRQSTISDRSRSAR